ncbi:hypothetical protein [Paenibacillus sp. 1A_MP2]|uniref:hypothetical protein n=1 Tax=Paenibacillus sp. 1A_MP2 TaxID=3457495 RepID=UPI003FCC5B2A
MTKRITKYSRGMVGETEPLKQLGVNMSVVNMEAYAMSQGITKSWLAMTQSEQAMLRYGYLLQVTADAQGDFARNGQSMGEPSPYDVGTVEHLQGHYGCRIH